MKATVTLTTRGMRKIVGQGEAEWAPFALNDAIEDAYTKLYDFDGLPHDVEVIRLEADVS